MSKLSKFSKFSKFSFSKFSKRRLKLACKSFVLVLFSGLYIFLYFRYGKKAQLAFAQFFGGLGMFVYGMWLMSESLQRIAGARLKAVISTLTQRPLWGLLTGAFVTAIIQSSSATTVMVVGFVNAGLMTLGQAIGVILGANIGTTMTAQLIAFDLTDIVWPVLAIGSGLMLLSKTRSYRSWGEVALGFAFLFLGMSTMGSALRVYHDHSALRTVFVALSNYRLLGVLAGVLVTLVVQSSSATVGLTMSLIAAGAFGDDPRLAMMAAVPIILGDNIGTCVTAMLAAIGTNANAKRAAVAHLTFNALGTVALLPFLGPYVDLQSALSSDLMRQVANSHSLFNIINACIFLPLVGFLERIVCWIVPDTAGIDSSRNVHLDKRMLATPAIALGQVTDELTYIFRQVEGMFVPLEAFLHSSDHDADDLFAVSENLDRTGKNLNESLREINAFLIALTRKDLTDSEGRGLSRLLYLAKDLEITAGQVLEFKNIIHENMEREHGFPATLWEELAICFGRSKELFEALDSRFMLTSEEGGKLAQIIYGYSLLDNAVRENHIGPGKQGETPFAANIAFFAAMRSLRALLSSCDYFVRHAQNQF